MVNLVGIIVPAIVFFSMVAIAKIISDHKTRSRLIEKGLVDENIKYLYPKRFGHNLPSSLKWGMVLIGVGLAFLIGQLVPSDVSDEVTVGTMFILAGVGLLIYYFIAKRKVNQSKESSSREGQ